MERWTVSVGKGGSSKTTTATAIAACLGQLGRKVLVLDLDGQAHASWLLMGGGAVEGPSMADVLLRRASATEAIRPTSIRGVDILPATAELGAVAVQLSQELSRDTRLRAALAEVGGYDYAIADTPPTFGPLLANAMVWAEKVLAPIDCGSILGILGLVDLETLIAEVQGAYNAGLTLGGIVLTKVARTNVHRDIEHQLRQRFGPVVLETTVPASVRVEEAASHARTVVQHAPKSPAAVAYMQLTEEVIRGREARGRGDVGGRSRKGSAA